MPSVKIETTTKDLRPLLNSAPGGPLYTGIKVGDQWFNLEGDHRSLRNQVVDLEFFGKIAKFATPQQPPAQHQTPPPLPMRPLNNGQQQQQPQRGHTPRWPSRDAAVEAWLFYYGKIIEYCPDHYAAVKGTDTLFMAEEDGEINPVHESPQSDGKAPPVVPWETREPGSQG
jgi:hypothetical protein